MPRASLLRDASSPSPGMRPTIASRPKRMEVPGTWNRLSRMTAHRRSESSRITRLYFFETTEDTEGTEPKRRRRAGSRRA